MQNPSPENSSSFSRDLKLEKTADLLAGLGNHEAKLLTLLAMGLNDHYLSGSQLGNKFRAFIGQDAEWIPSINVPFGYCQNSLEPLGHVVEGRVKGHRGPTVAYKISEHGKKTGIPYAGLLAQWSLRYPEISLQQVFGPTHSKGEVRAPESRIQLITELLTTPDLPLSLTDAIDTEPEYWEGRRYVRRLANISSASDALELAGILKVDRLAQEGNTREFIISDPARSLVSTRTPHSETVDMFYDFVKQCNQLGKERFNFEEALTYILGVVQQKASSLDPSVIRSKLISLLVIRPNEERGVNHNLPLPGIQRLESYNNGSVTKLQINEAHHNALENLMNIVLAIADEDPEVIAQGFGATRFIWSNLEARRALIAKAKFFSNNATKIPLEQMTEQLIALLKDSDRTLDTKTLHDMYVSEYSRPISKATLLRALGHAASSELVVVSKERRNPSIRKLSNFYGISSIGRAAVNAEVS